VEVLGPDVNESKESFTVNKEGQVRFGLVAIKGAGNAAVHAIISEREKAGDYVNIFDFTKRVSRAVNKKTLEALAMAGGFDCFTGHHRRQYLEAPEGDITLLEKAVKYAQKVIQEAESSQVSLFGNDSGMEVPVPNVQNMEPFSQLQQLNIEKEVVGLYISGHPLDQFKVEFEAFTNTPLTEFSNTEALRSKGDNIKAAGIVTSFAHRTTKTGKPFGTLTMEDYHGGHTFFIFGEDYIKFKEYFMTGWFLYLTGSVHPNKWKEGEFEFKINHIMLLSDVRSRMIKGLRVHIDLDDLTLDLMEKLEIITQKYKGEARLYINVIDKKENITLDLMSKKYQIDPSNDMIHELENLPEVIYKII
jgi:DNA polymerase-3 subunit alpha